MLQRYEVVAFTLAIAYAELALYPAGRPFVMGVLYGHQFEL
jgi:hypothetical protein